MLKIFIRRPVFASVISILMVFLGVLSLREIPITLFPDIVPPSVIVTAKYQGANADVCVKAVATPLERAINGVPGMTYLQTVTTNTGTTTIQIFFKVGQNPDIAVVNVQTRVATVLDELPEEVVKAGVSIEKEVNSLLMYINIMSDDNSADEKFVYNFADINILQELKRIEGVGLASILGAKDYAMRIWLKPDKMNAYSISSKEVIAAIRSQNIEAAPGTIGESSDRMSQDLLYILRYTGKFKTPEEYKDIVVKNSSDGVAKLKIRDIAEVEFGSQAYELVSRTDGRPSASIVLKQRPGSNARNIIHEVKKKMEHLQHTIFPVGMRYNINYDVSEFLDASVHEILRTLVEAFILVFVVVFLFLQSGRLVAICLLTIPVSLVGAITFMYLMDFSMNTLTLFALVLAIGIVVDDVIVVVESVHEKIMEGYNPYQAAMESIDQIGRAVVAITLVMAAIFIPMAFISGPVGVFYKQFSLTLAVAIFISGVSALTLTPTLCSIILRPHHPHAKHISNWLFFRKMEQAYQKCSDVYLHIVREIVLRKYLTIPMVVLFTGLGYWTYSVLPSGFVPVEDQGVIYANVTTPPGATLERTENALKTFQKITEELPVIQSVSTLAGYSLINESTGPNYGMALINLKTWKQRRQHVNDVIAQLQERTLGIRDADIQFVTPPTVPGFGNTSGFELRILDKNGDENYTRTESVTRQCVNHLRECPELTNVFSDFNVSFPQFVIHIDRDLAVNQGVSVDEALFELQVMLGGYYSSNFIRFGQMYKVMLQSLPEYRNKPSDIMHMYVKNKNGAMVSYSTFAHLEQVYGPQQLTRYNMYTSSLVSAQPTTGYSTGQVIARTQQILDSILPQGFSYEWSGITREEIASGNQFFIILLISIGFVYLILSAQYESFILPLAVLLALPIGYFGSLFGLKVMGGESNVYTQVAIIMLMGLLGKNAILIVEFARQQCARGISPTRAALMGARARLRPIVMTSFAFIFSLTPLCLSTGAGAVGNKSIGFAAFYGMLIGTIFGLMVVPGLFYIFARCLKYENHPSPHL